MEGRELTGGNGGGGTLELGQQVLALRRVAIVFCP